VSLSDDLIIGAEGAAEFTGLTKRAIYNLVETGRLPVVKMGRRLYFRKSELEWAFSSGQQAALQKMADLDQEVGIFDDREPLGRN
jgi:excisionase family DNA binding protein